MTSAEEVAKVLDAIPEKHNRILRFVGLLSRASSSEIVIVGGSAIEIYTRGGYVSGDIDIRADRESVQRVLRSWGFAHKGRLWVRADWGIAIDVVGDKYTGDLYRVTTLSTPEATVQIAVVEDLFIKRLAAAKHWRVEEALDEADLLWTGYHETMDPAYLDRKAREYDVADVLEAYRNRPRRRRRNGSR